MRTNVKPVFIGSVQSALKIIPTDVIRKNASQARYRFEGRVAAAGVLPMRLGCSASVIPEPRLLTPS